MELDGYEYGEEVVEVMDGVKEKTIFVKGNMETPCIVEITPSMDLSDITLKVFGEDNIVIKNLEKGKNVIINGQKGKVTVDNLNKFFDIKMWEFPRLKNGKNTIIIDEGFTSIRIKYISCFI